MTRVAFQLHSGADGEHAKIRVTAEDVVRITDLVLDPDEYDAHPEAHYKHVASKYNYRVLYEFNIPALVRDLSARSFSVHAEHPVPLESSREAQALQKHLAGRPRLEHGTYGPTNNCVTHAVDVASLAGLNLELLAPDDFGSLRRALTELDEAEGA
jgi:hypothetical protein